MAHYSGILWNSHVPLDVVLYSDDVRGLVVENEPVDATTMSDASPRYVRGHTRFRVELTDEAAERIGAALARAFEDNKATMPAAERESVQSVLRGIAIDGEF